MTVSGGAQRDRRISVEIGFGDFGWRSLFHRDCPETRFGGIVAPASGESHVLPDGAQLAPWVCNHCGVRFYAGLNTQRRVTVIALSDTEPPAS